MSRLNVRMDIMLQNTIFWYFSYLWHSCTLPHNSNEGWDVDGGSGQKLILVSFVIGILHRARPSVRVSVQNLLRYSFEISYMDSSQKIIDTYFFKSGLSPFVELCPF